MGKYNVHGGHNSKVQGANKYLNEVTEDRKVKNKIIELFKENGHTVYDCTDDSGSTQSANLSNIVKKCNAHTVDLDISIHLNAGGGTGVEVLYYSGDSNGKTISERVSKKVAGALGLKDRGAKPRSDLYVLNNTKATAILVECCFVDSKTDEKAWDVDKCAKAIVEGVLNKEISKTKKSVDVQLYTPNNTDAQRWIPRKNDDGTYCLQNVSSGLYLDVKNAGKTSKTPVWVYEKNNSNAQKWLIKQVGVSNYDPDFVRPVEIIPFLNENLRLDCVNGGNSNGTKIQIYTNNQTTAQQWSIVDTGIGQWIIINVDSSKALDVVGGGK